MNWIDEGALYSQIAVFLREDLGRGDLTTQSIIARNTRARARFVAGEQMIIAGLEAAEEVFLTLDGQQQLEAFVSDGESVEAGKVIARMTGFADVFLAGERVALNLMQHLSGIATLTHKFMTAIAGTDAQIVDSRSTTPGLRMLEKYAVMLGGGQPQRFGLDDGLVITSNHIQFAGGISGAVKAAKERVGRLHRIEVQVSSAAEVKEALDAGAEILAFVNTQIEQFKILVVSAREILPSATITYTTTSLTPDEVRPFVEAGADLISIPGLTNSARAMDITFQVQPF
jgi:nicotinate-nucleotide pyrophosphorylase (carboxylating)